MKGLTDIEYDFMRTMCDFDPPQSDEWGDRDEFTKEELVIANSLVMRGYLVQCWYEDEDDDGEYFHVTSQGSLALRVHTTVKLDVRI